MSPSTTPTCPVSSLHTASFAKQSTGQGWEHPTLPPLQACLSLPEHREEWTRGPLTLYAATV